MQKFIIIPRSPSFITRQNRLVAPFSRKIYTNPVKLSQDDLQLELKSLKDWKLQNNGLHCQFQPKSFDLTKSFIIALLNYATETDHHPRLVWDGNKVELYWTTHDVDGISDKDIHAAKFSSQTYSKLLQ